MAKKILIISGIRIFPPQSGGHLRTANLARALARNGQEVVLYSLTARKADYQQHSKFQSLSIEAGLVEIVDGALWRGICQTVFRRLSLARIWQYFFLRYHFLPRRLKQEIEKADLILADFPFFSFIPRLQAKKELLLISHNLEHQIFTQESWWKARFISPWVRRLEARSAKLYRAILVCTPEDGQFFKDHGASPHQLIELPNGVDGHWYRRQEESRQKLREHLGIAADETVLLFTASAYEPNRQAFAWLQEFIRANFQELRRRKLRFLVVGSVAAKPYRDEVLIVTSFVDDIRPYFSASDVAINPVETGSGSNVKIYEAIAAELPLLSTEFGARGLSLHPGRDYMPFDKTNLLEALELVSARHLELRAWGARVLASYQDSVLMEKIVAQRLAEFL